MRTKTHGVHSYKVVPVLGLPITDSSAQRETVPWFQINVEQYNVPYILPSIEAASIGLQGLRGPTLRVRAKLHILKFYDCILKYRKQ